MHSNRARDTEKLKATTRLKKNKTWNTAQIKTIKKSHEHRLIRPQIQHKELEHMHLKFLTLYVEKIGCIHGIRLII
jgi:hypothetical protein